MSVLALNCGSSSVKLAIIDPSSGARSVTALAEEVGTPAVSVTVRRGSEASVSVPADPSHRGVVAHLVSALTAEELESLVGVGHRVVHGGSAFTTSTLVTEEVLAELESVAALAPLQVPGNIAGIRATRAALPDVPNVAVFDTAFHQTLPPRAYRYAVPASWHEAGVRRYGFHGISHRYVSGRAAAMLGRSVAEVRLVSLHLGNGCSAAAVRDGVSVDTTMGLTPLEGLVMGTRSGDIDAGALGFAAERLGLDLAGVLADLNHRSGLLGLSGLSNDMRTLAAAAEAGDERAALAIEVFCYRAAKAVAALSVPLGRLDALVFTGGIGEHAAGVRAGILGHLGVLDLAEDETANAAHGAATGGRVSLPGPVAALVVPTDEELLIAQDTAGLVHPPLPR